MTLINSVATIWGNKQMKYIFRILFMPVIIIVLQLVVLMFVVNLLITGDTLTADDQPWLLELIDRWCMPLIREMK